MHVIIVGGGAAGIAAAYTLLKKRAQVTLFEARNRYGGRAVTDTSSIPGFEFDMGCQYLQDPETNPWNDIAQQLKFETVKESYRSLLRLPQKGGWIDAGETGVDGGVGKATTAIGKSFEANKTKKNMPVDYQQEKYSHDFRFAMALSPYGPVAESAEIWQYIAADRARQKERKVVSPNLFVKGGLGTLIKTYGERLKTQYSATFKEWLNSEVTRISHSANGVSVATKNGKSANADACVVTASVGVIDHIDFEPALPSTHLSALEYLKLGSYKKIALGLRKEPRSIAKDTHYYCLQYDLPHGVWQYYRLSRFPTVLVAHTFGDFARALDQRPAADVVAMLKATLEAAYPKELDYTGRSAITNWSNDSYAGGAYSYTAPKLTGFSPWPNRVFDGPKSFEFTDPAQAQRAKQIVLEDASAYNARLRLGAPIETLWFAGEATDEDAYGTIAGAYNEGVRAANEILERIDGKPKQQKPPEQKPNQQKQKPPERPKQQNQKPQPQKKPKQQPKKKKKG